MYPDSFPQDPKVGHAGFSVPCVTSKVTGTKLHMLGGVSGQGEGGQGSCPAVSNVLMNHQTGAHLICIPIHMDQPRKWTTRAAEAHCPKAYAAEQ